MCAREQIMESLHVDSPMLPVTSEAPKHIENYFRMHSKVQISFWGWILPVIN